MLIRGEAISYMTNLSTVHEKAISGNPEDISLEEAIEITIEIIQTEKPYFFTLQK